MNVRFLSGPKAGQTEHVHPIEGRTLVTAGIAEEIKTKNFAERMRLENPPAAPEIPKWSVELFGVLQQKISIVMRLGATTVVYQGKPEDVNARQEWKGGGRFLSGFGSIVPDGVVGAYRKAYRNAAPGHRLEIPAPEPNQANTEMARAVADANSVLRANEKGIAAAGLTGPQALARVLPGGGDGEVTYEQHDPSF